ncbi:MAG: DUF2892 domain-containing protein [Pseudomonadota bacterium]
MISAPTPIRLIPHAPRMQSSWQNVEGWERALSLAGGVLMMGKGLRRGGVSGLVQLAMGGLVLARGVSGHCATKQLISDQYAEMADIRFQLETAGRKLAQLQAAAHGGSAT